MVCALRHMHKLACDFNAMEARLHAWCVVGRLCSFRMRQKSSCRRVACRLTEDVASGKCWQVGERSFVCGLRGAFGQEGGGRSCAVWRTRGSTRLALQCAVSIPSASVCCGAHQRRRRTGSARRPARPVVVIALAEFVGHPRGTRPRRRARAVGCGARPRSKSV